MKTISCLVLYLSACLSASVVVQAQPDMRQVAEEIQLRRTGQENVLTHFDLDFPGGTPGQLVAAIETAMGRRLNAIVPSEDAEAKLPPLKLTNVDVAHLFTALERASQRQVVVRVRGSSLFSELRMGFKTEGSPSDDSIWYFYRHENSGPPPEVASQFYLLTPYLDAGLTVDDITTAIQTGWKMLGEKPTPTLSFHQETKLLIAVGERHQLQVIEQVLGALQPTLAPAGPRSASAPTPDHKPQE